MRNLPSHPYEICDKINCHKRARHRVVLLLRASKHERVIPHPLNFVLCDTHQGDFRNVGDIFETLDDNLWDVIVGGLSPSGKIPKYELTNMTWDPI